MASSSRGNEDRSARSGTAGNSAESQTDYCIRTLNYIISTLHLPIHQLRTLQDLQMEYLLRIHCSLHGIDFATTDFIHSAHDTEDISRIILFLKDRYGADQFNALEANKIADKDPTQLRFLLEIFHLILDHKLEKANKLKQAQLVTSHSGNHLDVPGYNNKSNLDITKTRSFYVLPNAQDTPQETMDESSLDPTSEVDGSDASFQTIENIVINVVNETLTDDDPSESELNDENNKTSQKENVSDQVFKKQQSLPLSSSPVGKGRKPANCNTHQSPNVTAIRKSKSTMSNLQRTINCTNLDNTKARSQSVPRKTPCTSKRQPTTQKKNVTLLAKNDHFGKYPDLAGQTSKQPQQKQRQKPNETHFLSTTDSDCLGTENLTQLRDIHSKLRCEITESLISLDKDISKLKRKPPPQSKSSSSQSRGHFQKNLPDMRWLLPVDCRFPNYTKSVIIPKCTSWRSNLKQRPTRSPSLDLRMYLDYCNSKQYPKGYSVLAQRGSSICEDKLLELSEEEYTDE